MYTVIYVQMVTYVYDWEEFFMTTGLYRSIHAQPQAVREVVAGWELPTQAAERLARTGRVFLAGIGTRFQGATVCGYLLRPGGAHACGLGSCVAGAWSLHLPVQ